MNEKSCFSIASAVATNETTGAHAAHVDEDSLHVETSHAVRSLAEAVKRFWQLVNAALAHEPLAHDRDKVLLLQFAAQLDALLTLLDKFAFEVENAAFEVDDKSLQLKIVNLLRNVTQLFGGRNDFVNESHVFASIGLAFFKLGHEISKFTVSENEFEEFAWGRKFLELALSNGKGSMQVFSGSGK